MLFNLQQCLVVASSDTLWRIYESVDLLVKNVSSPKCIYSDNQICEWSFQLLQITPDVLCECFLQTDFLHTTQHCFTFF